MTHQSRNAGVRLAETDIWLNTSRLRPCEGRYKERQTFHAKPGMETASPLSSYPIWSRNSATVTISS